MVITRKRNLVRTLTIDRSNINGDSNDVAATSYRKSNNIVGESDVDEDQGEKKTRQKKEPKDERKKKKETRQKKKKKKKKKEKKKKKKRRGRRRRRSTEKKRRRQKVRARQRLFRAAKRPSEPLARCGEERLGEARRGSERREEAARGKTR